MMGDSTKGVNYIYRQLLQNLTAYRSGPLIVRIGGNSTDFTGEPTASTARPFAEVASAVGARFTLGVNLGADNVNLAVDQANAFVSQMPAGTLDAIEIGNEPDSYATSGMRPTTYTYLDYVSDFDKWKTNIKPVLPSGTQLMGASWAWTGMLKDAQSYISDEGNSLALFSQHKYVAGGLEANPPDILLTPAAATSGAQAVASAVATSHEHGIAFRMGEMNSLSNGGGPGISDAFGSALWAVDTMFEYASVGVDGVNWHSGNGGAYALFEFVAQSSESGNSYSLTSVRPLYYGLLLFQEATGNGARLLPVTLGTEANLTAWATVDASGTTRLVMINKDEQLTGNVDIAANGYTHAQVLRLTAPSYQFTSGVTLAGQTFDTSTNGVIQGGQTVESIDASDGIFQIPMPITSAALVVFSK